MLSEVMNLLNLGPIDNRRWLDAKLRILNLYQV